jgi:hypothetical protein
VYYKFFKLIIFLRTLLRIYEKKSNSKKLKNKKFFGCPSCPKFRRILFLGHIPKPKIGIL